MLMIVDCTSVCELRIGPSIRTVVHGRTMERINLAVNEDAQLGAWGISRFDNSFRSC